MSDEQAICATCKNVVIDNKEQWFRWTCYAYPNPQRFNFVTGILAADPPYAFCRHINTNGNCQQYEQGPNKLQPKGFPEER